MTSILLVVHVLTAVTIVVFVLMQQGKGADMGAAFGGGSQTLFGARGSANFLSRLTGLLAAIFFVTSLTLAYLHGNSNRPQSVTEQVIEQPVKVQSDIPQAPGSSDAQDSPPAAGGAIPAAPETTQD